MGDEEQWPARRGQASVFGDHRGKLTLVPAASIPFEVRRSYVLSELPAGARRAGHACRTQHRFLVGISGVAIATVDDGRDCRQTRLAGGDTIHVPPGTWLELEADGGGVVVLVFADGEYDPSDYVRDRTELSRAPDTAAATAPDAVTT